MRRQHVHAARAFSAASSGSASTTTESERAARAVNDSSSSPLLEARSGARPAIALPDGTGTVHGVHWRVGQDAFLGIPYAQPPVGSLRFVAARRLDKNPKRNFDGSQFGAICIQDPTPGYDQSEDCLSINVIKPSATTSKARLPVVVWVHGGGFTEGGSAYPVYNGSMLVERSWYRKEPVIFVSLNYRLGPFGLLGGKEIWRDAKNSQSANLNAALFDVHTALLWVQRNIRAFGGDPDKVTVWGQSAGAAILGSMQLADQGRAVRKNNLFRGAILQSGGPAMHPIKTVDGADQDFATIAYAAGCGNEYKAGKALPCLRQVPARQLLQIAENHGISWNRVEDSYFHPELPCSAIRHGRVAKVPVMMGTVLDEGTLFVNGDVTTDSQLVGIFVGGAYAKLNTAVVKNAAHWDKVKAVDAMSDRLLQLYPNNPVVGSPYDPVGVSKDDRFYGSNNQYKRMASIEGDRRAESGKRMLLGAMNSGTSYVFKFVADTPGGAAQLGVSHGSDLPFAFGLIADQGGSKSLVATSNFMASAFMSFVYNQNPNGAGLAHWPAYGSSKNLLRIGAGSFDVTPDTYREAQINFMMEPQWTASQDT